MNWPLWSTQPYNLDKIKARFAAKSRAKRRLIFWSVIFVATIFTLMELVFIIFAIALFGIAPLFLFEYWREMRPLV